MSSQETPPRSVRDLLFQLHLWLGLGAGLVIAVVCATGTILTYRTELEMALDPERYHVEPRGPRLTLDELVARAQVELPELRISSITTHDDERRSVELGVGRGDTVFVHPSTGEILGRHVFSETFLYDVFALHRWLLAGDTGKRIVGVSTLVFLVVLVSGLFLWWPRNKRELRDRLRVKRTRNPARLVFDLHVSLGFYAMPFLFLMAFTGLAWSFDWFHDGIYWVTRSSPPSREAPTVEPTDAPISLEAARASALSALGEASHVTLSLPQEPDRAWTARALSRSAPHDRALDAVHLDPSTGQVFATDRYQDRNLGARTRSTFYAIHVGTIFGEPTRLLAFVTSLLGATFPITGFLMWLRKRRGAAKRARSMPVFSPSSASAPEPSVKASSAPYQSP